jgi:hypothetical protein
MIYYSKQKVQAAQQGATLLNNDARLRKAVLRNVRTMGGPMKNTTPVTPILKAPIAPLKQSFPSRVNESTNVPKIKPILTTEEAANSLIVKQKAGAAKAYLNEWMASPRYMEMIKTSAPKNYQKITERRRADLNSAQASYMHRDKGNTAADSKNSDGSIRVFRKGVGTNGTLVHELSHSSDRTGERLPITDVKRIAMFSNNAYSAVNKIDPNERAERRRWVSYVTDPSETRARLNDVRFQSKERSIYDPFKQKVTPEIYDTIKSQNFEDEQHSGFDALMQLRDIYSDREVINLLNTVSENKKKALPNNIEPRYS